MKVVYLLRQSIIMLLVVIYPVKAQEHNSHEGHAHHNMTLDKTPVKAQEHNSHEGHAHHNMTLDKTPVKAQEHNSHEGHAHHNMTLDETGVIMNNNHHALPEDCKEISRDYSFEVIAETRFASRFPGTIFGLSEHEYRVEPCSRITVTFVNKDEVRHQWMIHGLPRYLYPGGMFHLEAAGGYSQKGTFIVPSDDLTYLVHCDMAQHMEKGMKAQLKVGKGSGDLWAIPGISTEFTRDNYLPENIGRYVFTGMLFMGIAIVVLCLPRKVV